MSQCSGGGGALSTAAGGPWRARLQFADAGRVGGAAHVPQLLRHSLNAYGADVPVRP